MKSPDKKEMRALIEKEDNARIKILASSLGMTMKEFFHRISQLSVDVINKLLNSQ